MSCNLHARKRKEADSYLSLFLTVCSGCSQCLPTHLQSASLDHNLQHCWQGKPPAQNLLYLCSCPRRGGGDRRTRSHWLASRSPGQPWGICTGPELQAGAETRRQSHTHNWRRGATLAREWVQEKHALGGRWIVAESRHQSEHRGGQESSKSVVHTQTNTFTVWGANGSWSSSATPISTSLLTFKGPNEDDCVTVKSDLFASIWFAAIGFT